MNAMDPVCSIAGSPSPFLDEEMMEFLAVTTIRSTNVIDYSVRGLDLLRKKYEELVVVA